MANQNSQPTTTLPTDIFSQSESLLLAFLNNSPAIGWLKDSEGRHIFLSKPYLEEIGVPCTNWYGKTDFDLWPTAMAEKFRAHDQQVMSTWKLTSFEDVENVSFPDGKARTWWVVKFPFRDCHGHKFVGGMAIDITKTKRAEKARRILEREIAEVAEKEQRRIAQDLHDGIGQELIAHSLFAVSIAEKIDAAVSAGLFNHASLADLQPLAHKLAHGIAQSNRHLQLISRGMYPVHVDANRLMTTLNELANMTNELPGITCSFASTGEIELEDEIATHLFRIAQEAVNNAVKHSGCSQIKILLELKSDRNHLTIIDNGRGMPAYVDPVDTGMGLRIMHYRAELASGILSIMNVDSGGTGVHCSLERRSS